MATLVQERLFSQRTFELTGECIRVVDRDTLGSRSYNVPYEVLFGDRIDHRMTSTQAALLFAIIGAAVPVFLLILALDTDLTDLDRWELFIFSGVAALVSIVCGLCWLFSRRDLIQFVDGRSSLYIRRDRPSVDTVDAFLAEARKRGLARVRSRLLPLERTDDERKDRDWAFLLYDRGIISAEERDEYVHPAHSPYRVSPA